MKRAALSVTLLLAGRFLFAAAPGVSVRIVSEAQPPVWDVFSGAPAKLRLEVEAPLGAKVTLRADLYQFAQTIGAPLSTDLSVGGELSFADRTHQVVEASLPMPEVKRMTKVLARFRAQSAGDEKWQSAEQAMLVVYPPDVLDSFRKSLAAQEVERGTELAVFGESRKLRGFLHDKKIPFHDAGNEFPTAPQSKSIHLAETSAQKLGDRLRYLREARFVIFDRESSALPGVYSSTSGAGFFVKVTLPILDDVSTSPRAQQTFADILTQALQNPLPPSP